MEAATKQEEQADEGREAVRTAAAGKKVSPEASNAAVDWFLSDDEPLTKTIEFNVGDEQHERWIPWEIKPVDIDVLKRIRKSSNDLRAERRGEGGFDEMKANLKIVVAGTVKPDLREMAQARSVPAPEEALRLKFAQKPGLLNQISQSILALSGYDDADLREAGQAVGN